MGEASRNKSSTNGAIARKYEKMSPREHVLRRPDTYIGSTGVVEELHDVIKDGRVKSVDMSYTPGLAKVFDECLVNALDHVVRVAETGGSGSVKVTEINVTIDKDSGVLGVFNDGDGIDVVEHPVYKVYVPQLVFGELLTSTNYDDSGLEKLWGGRNGYGAKLANIWALWFEVETFDRARGLHYKQRFESNMSVVGKPKVRSKKSGKPFTSVKFLPDYARMHLAGLSDDMAALLSRRAFDAAACTPASVAVRLNGDKIPIKTFKDYVGIFDIDEGKVAHFSTRNGRWDVALTSSTHGTFEHVSFVNGISTRKGGTHVNMVANLIAKTMSTLATKKAGANVKTSYIKDNMRLFLRCVVPDPTFSSQTKEELTSPASKFSASFDIKQSDITKLAKNSGVMERAEALMQFHENRMVKASAGKKQARLIISKLDDANNAGTKRSGECTLILTEGDSAKTMAISGLAVVGRDNYGVFPLRGKLLNISDKSVATALKNEEVANIVKILGLKPGQSNSIGNLRYGRVMIMADADDDGIHIRALVINLFRVMFPDLFKTDGFLVSMLTPVIKVSTAKDNYDFYSVRDFKTWQTKHPKSSPVVKYLKGLGSSTSSDAKQYFKDMRVVEYTFSPESDDRMSLAFSKARADDRKLWLMSYSDTSALPDYTRKQVDYATFVDTELIRFSIRDCARSLPHIMDGLKESTRKILFGAMKHTPRDSHIKVAQLAGFVSKVSKYLHGEDSLNRAITSMAQTFPGSNNLALLDQDGQFGSRLMGGEDRASPRYIHTRLADIATKVFRPEDDVILEYKSDEGATIEPITYYPIIPMVLVNGVISIATGFSCSIPMFDPSDLIQAILDHLDGKKMRKFTPWFRGWTGKVESDGKGGFVSSGSFSRGKGNTIVIQELPAYRWTEDQKVLLEDLMGQGVVKNFRSQYTDTSVRFDVEFAGEVSDDEVVSALQLRSNRNLSTSNVHLFSVDGSVTKFKTLDELMRVWLTERSKKYADRKRAVLAAFRKDLVIASAKARFISEVVDGTIKVMDAKADQISAKLKERKFPLDEDSSYEYLLKMPINQLTRERKDKLLAYEKSMKDEVDALVTTSPDDLWRKDLAELKSAWSDLIKKLA
jgi:DNA topoisomerase-2